jgi:carbamoyltransferase
MYILGLNVSHNSSAALIKDGKIVAAIEEERLNRMKRTTTFAKYSVKWVLNQGNITLDDVDHVAVAYDFELLKNNKNPWEHNTIAHDDTTEEGFKRILDDNYRQYYKIKRELETYGFKKWINVHHHMAHAAGTYFLSGFNEANIIVLDGRGEDTSTSLMYGKDGTIEIIKQFPIKDSLGHIYTYVTHLCGLYSNIGQEGKTMGLAPYGKPDPAMETIFNKIITFNNGAYSVNRDQLRKLKKYEQPEGKINETSRNLAFYVQKTYEEALLFLAGTMYNLTKNPYFALSGGVALNCEANRLLLEQDFVKNIYVQPSAYDGGSAIGAALYVYSTLKKLLPAKAEDAYLGPSFSNEDIEKALRLYSLKYEKVTEPESAAAELLAKGDIIGWFQGKMEFGPRALGNRSIFADPRKEDMKDKVNNRVKYREDWRPFAPAVLLEKMDEYFGMTYESPHMTVSLLTNEDKRKDIQAAIHIDGTARLQTVSRQSNLKFHTLLNKFYEITGVPVLLNTSFNIKGEPIVCTPRDAIRTFYSSGLNALIMGDFLLQK